MCKCNYFTQQQKSTCGPSARISVPAVRLLHSAGLLSVYLLQQQRAGVFGGQLSKLNREHRRPLLHPETQTAHTTLLITAEKTNTQQGDAA